MYHRRREGLHAALTVDLALCTIGEGREPDAEAEPRGPHAFLIVDLALCITGEGREQEAEAEAKGPHAAQGGQAGHRLPGAA